MTDKKAATIKRKIFFRLFYEILIAAAICVSLFFALSVVFREYTVKFLLWIFGDVSSYYEAIEYRVAIFIVLFVVIVIIVICHIISKLINYINMLTNSIDNIVNRDDDIITLPPDLKEIEAQLNVIRYTAVRNEQIAKESEQQKNDLIVYLAHDLKTPLTSVIGYLSLLKDEKQISEELREKYIAVALNKSYRLEELINEFFDITRFNLQNVFLEKSNINLSIMLRQLAEEFFPVMSEKGITIDIQVTDGLAVNGDRDKLARVFDNLLRNAVNYSFRDTKIYVFSEEDQNMVTIKFKNSGEMIPEHKLQKIFEQFFRMDTARTSEKGGAGLGLAIAKQLVDLHGGTITAVSDQEYTEFIVKIPKKIVRNN